MTTLKDLSRHLGLSVTQVSRALNGYPDVSEKTRERVVSAAEALDYTPNVAARRLVSGRSGVVGFIACNVESIRRNAIFFETVSGLSSAFSAHGIQFILHLTPETDRGDIVPVYDRLFRGGTLDGFVLIDPAPGDLRMPHLQAKGIPFVVHGRAEPHPDHAFVDVDNRALTCRLARHLIDRGHRRIAMISGPEHLGFARSRLAGLKDALRAAGLPFDASLVRHGGMTEALGRTAVLQFFGGTVPAPTGVICGNTSVAKGVYQALGALSLRVPDDVSVVAHDDVVQHAQADGFTPALTVTRAALAESWDPIAGFLVEAIHGTPPAQLQRVLPFEFVERGSSGPARRRA